MDSSTTAPASNRRHVAIGTILVVAGLIGHVLAAYLNGGSAIAYQHHIIGFVIILAVSGAALGLLARFVWRGRIGLTMLWLGIVQAAFGALVVYFEMR